MFFGFQRIYLNHLNLRENMDLNYVCFVDRHRRYWSFDFRVRLFPQFRVGRNTAWSWHEKARGKSRREDTQRHNDVPFRNTSSYCWALPGQLTGSGKLQMFPRIIQKTLSWHHRSNRYLNIFVIPWNLPSWRGNKIFRKDFFVSVTNAKFGPKY